MVPRSSIKSIITKWKQHGTTANLPRESHPPKLVDRASRTIIKEAAQKPKVTRVPQQRLESLYIGLQ